LEAIAKHNQQLNRSEAHVRATFFVITGHLINIIRQGGTLGLIATNTIAQGDTRASGLRFVCNNGGMIYNATRRYKWPGVAAVVVSVIHIWKTSKRLGAKQA
jgi:hypothetical protein